MSDTNSPNFLQWKEESATNQQRLYCNFGDREWDVFLPSNISEIETKIALYLFSKILSDLDESQKKIVIQSHMKLRELSGSCSEMHLGCSYISILTKAEYRTFYQPVLRTRNRYSQHITYFYEHNTSRVYTCWHDFLNNNKLPAGWMCYPETGFYHAVDGMVKLNYRETPSPSVIGNILDWTSIGIGIASGGILLASSVFPPLLIAELPAVIALISASSYNVTRNVYDLVDRGMHQENLLSVSTLGSWLDIVTSIGGATAGAAALRFCPVLMRCLSLGVNTFGAIMCVVDLIFKYMQGQLSLEELDKFVALCLLFGNIIITTNSARYIVKVVSEQPKRLLNLFNLVGNTSYSVCKYVANQLSFSNALQIISGDCIMNFVRNIGLSRTSNLIEVLVRSVGQLRRGVIDYVRLFLDINENFVMVYNEFYEEISSVVMKLRKYFNTFIESLVIAGNRLFADSPQTVNAAICNEVEGITENARMTDRNQVEHVHEKTLQCVKRLAENTNCPSDSEFVSICEMVCDQINKKYEQEVIVETMNAPSYDGRRLSDQNKSEILDRIINNLDSPSQRNKIMELVEERRRTLPSGRQMSALGKPLYQRSGVALYFFECDTKAGYFDQFVYESCCELLGENQLCLGDCELHLNSNGTTLLVEYNNAYVVFDYRLNKSVQGPQPTINGLVVILKLSSPR